MQARIEVADDAGHAIRAANGGVSFQPRIKGTGLSLARVKAAGPSSIAAGTTVAPLTHKQESKHVMKIEHIAVNVLDPVAMAAWYCGNLGFEVARKMDVAPFTHFLRDAASGVMIEIYSNPPDQVPDYAGMNPLALHLAFVSHDLAKDLAALSAAGARIVSEQDFPDGSRLAMLRDPWGLCIQLCQRAEGFFA